MSVEFSELSNQVLALSTSERVLLAQKLWESLEEGKWSEATEVGAEDIALAKRRDAELASGNVKGRTHDQVMEAARQATQCK
mgnify:CR=1 FL=1